MYKKLKIKVLRFYKRVFVLRFYRKMVCKIRNDAYSEGFSKGYHDGFQDGLKKGKGDWLTYWNELVEAKKRGRTYHK